MLEYMSAEDFEKMANDSTDKTLEYVVSLLYLYLLKKRNLRVQLESEVDEDVIGEIEWRLKLLRDEEKSLHRLESGLQSRLSAARAGVA